MGDNKLTLYSVTQEMAAIADTLESLEGSEDEALAYQAKVELQKRVQEVIVAKVDSFAAFVRHLEAQAELAKQEKLRLAERQAQFLRWAERLREYGLNCLKLAGLTKVEGAGSTLKVENLRAVVSVAEEIEEDPSVLRLLCPEAFAAAVEQKTVYKLDKRKLKTFLESFQGEIPGVSLQINRTKLEVK